MPLVPRRACDPIRVGPEPGRVRVCHRVAASNADIPAVGFAFGFDRLMEALSEQNLFPADLQIAKVLVTIFSKDLQDKSVEIASKLRSENIPTELYLNEDAKMEKQLKYADQKGIPYVVIIGPQEAEKNMVTLKNLKTREQTQVSLTDLPNELI